MNQLKGLLFRKELFRKNKEKEFSFGREKKRILFVLENFYPKIGGVEELFRSLTTGLVRQGYEVTVFTSHCGSRPLVENMDGVIIRRSRISNRYLFNLLCFKFLFLNVHRFDIVHGHFNTALPAFLVTLFRKAKLIITVHEYRGRVWFQLPFTSRLFKSLHYIYEKLVIRLPGVHFIAVSKNTLKDLVAHGLDRERISLIYNGLNYDKFSGYQWKEPNNSALTYTYFGRLGKCKGLDLIMGSFPMVVDKYPEAKLNLIIPKKPKGIFDYVKKVIEDNNLEGNVNIYHNLTRKDMFDVLIKSDFVVIPSYYEGFCFTAAEAVGLGVPIISSNTGALKNVVSGQFLNMEDMTVDSLYECILKASVGEWDYKTPRKFDLESNIEGHLDLYEKLLIAETSRFRMVKQAS